jgi:hypothetical protein
MMVDRPRLDRAPIMLPPLAGALGVVWEALAALAAAAEDLPWTVVGGQMVLLHGLERDQAPPRVSTDIDAAVDVRADRGALKRLVSVLGDLDFESTGVSPDGRAHRFARPVGSSDEAVVDVLIDDEQSDAGDKLIVDVLVPEGLGEKADIRTVGAATAFPAAGVTQALARTEVVPVEVGRTACWVPRPNLLGALVAKATAADVDNQDVERHHRDVVFLAGLIDDPIAMRADVGRKDRRRLNRLLKLLPADDPVWNASADAHAAIELLVNT